MKKKSMALYMTAAVLFSGAAGFGGTSLALLLNSPASEIPSYGSDASADGVMLPKGSNEVIPLSFADGADTAMTIPQVVAAVSDSVVEIATESVVSGGYFRSYIQSGAGSGVIISSDGYIITNNHVIASARTISVRTKSGETYKANLIGRDTRSDLAVIKIEAEGLKPARYGNSASLLVGEEVVAIGNPLGLLGGTVTEGIISATHRDITLSDGTVANLMQTSAAVNPGNSGGGLFNAYGDLVGIVNAKSNGSDVEGIGFAIPCDTVKSVVSQLIEYGFVQGRVDFGIELIDIDDIYMAMYYGVSSEGVYVLKSDAESGLRAGDRIVTVEGVTVSSADDVKEVYGKYKVGDSLKLTVSRSGKVYEASVVLKQAMY